MNTELKKDDIVGERFRIHTKSTSMRKGSVLLLVN